MRVRPAQPGDAAAWERMREALWPLAPGEHAGEIASFLNDVGAGFSRPDREADNPAGAAAHRALGFTEVGRIVCFRKPLA